MHGLRPSPAVETADATTEPRIAGRLVPLAVLLFAAFTSGAVVVTSPLDHDEHMYLAAAHLLDSGAMYADFAYFQTPYMPYVYRGALSLSGTDRVLAAARVIKLLIAVAIVFVLYRLSLRLSGDRWFGLACLLLLVWNDIFRDTLGHARNYDLPALLVLLGFWSFLSLPSTTRPGILCLVTGTLSGLAMGTKLTYGLVPLAFVGPIFIDRGVNRRSAALVSWFLLGAAIGLLPAMYLSLVAGLDRSWFNNVGYHQLNAAWRAETGFEVGMSFAGKLRFAKDLLWSAPTQYLAVLALFVGIGCARHSEGRLGIGGWPVICAVGLLIASVFMFLLPTPVWPSYFSPLVIWVTLLVAALYARLPCGARVEGRILAGVCVFLLLLFRMPGDLRLMYAALDPVRWPASETHRQGTTLRSALSKHGQDGPIATLSPIIALEAGRPIYPELSTGVFGYRVGGLLADHERSRVRLTSAADLGRLLQARRPAAVLTGFEGDMDSALEAFAIAGGYELLEGAVEKGTLYVRRGDLSPTPTTPVPVTQVP